MFRFNNRNFIALFIVISITVVIYFFGNNFTIILEKIMFPKEELIIVEANQYTRSFDFDQYETKNNFEPENIDDLINIFYTILNNGWDYFHFYCPAQYKSCLNDAKNIIQDDELLSSINNFVHPFNSYATFEATLNNLGKIIVRINHVYDEKMIEDITSKIIKIENEIINNTMTKTEKIKTVHDYIINNTVYDTKLVDTGNNRYKANTAYGVFMHGYAICGGYSDAMALFLDRFGINNYKISNDTHVWNYVNIDDNWLHLDLTWNDPVASSGINKLIYTYFLIKTDELNKLNTSGSHDFDINLY